jgi:multiple antibiotic resistance protein
MISNFLLSFTAIFVALDIIGAIPIYLSITRDLQKSDRNKVVNKSMAVALGVAVVFAFVGKALFDHIGITLYDFQIAGGIILLLIALADLHGGPESVKPNTGSTGIVPLAVPLITGPGVLTSLVLQVGQQGYVITLLALGLNYGFAWFLLRNCDGVQRVLGKEGTVVLSKIAALLLAAISVAMIRSGVFGSIRTFSL